MSDTLPKPFNSGHLVVSETPKHEMFYEEYGNKDGIPVFYCHGGPGVGTSANDPRFFDLKKYRVILFDQRGCGKSTYEHGKQLEANTTPDLVGDIEKLRVRLGLNDKKIHLFGGSWGSTLALAYSIAHPDSVASLTVRGIYLGRPQDNDYSFQADATDLGNGKMMGAGRFFEDEWRAFVNFIPKEERGDMIEAYRKRVASDDPKVSAVAIKHWYEWEEVTCNLVKPETLEADSSPEKTRNVTLAEIHYFQNGSFFPSPNYIIENADKLAKIPTINIIQGRWDVVCPPDQAHALRDAIKASNPDPSHKLNFTLTTAGHLASEPETEVALKTAMTDIALRQGLGLGAGRARAG